MRRIVSMNDQTAAAISEIGSLDLIIAARGAGAVYRENFIIVRRRIVGRERVIIGAARLCSGYGVQQGLVPGRGASQDLITINHQPARVRFGPLQMNDVAHSSS